MEEKERNPQDFDLEDILKEFSGDMPEEADGITAEEILSGETPEEEAPMTESSGEEVPEEAPSDEEAAEEEPREAEEDAAPEEKSVSVLDQRGRKSGNRTRIGIRDVVNIGQIEKEHRVGLSNCRTNIALRTVKANRANRLASGSKALNRRNDLHGYDIDSKEAGIFLASDKAGISSCFFIRLKARRGNNAKDSLVFVERILILDRSVYGYRLTRRQFTIGIGYTEDIRLASIRDIRHLFLFFSTTA